MLVSGYIFKGRLAVVVNPKSRWVRIFDRDNDIALSLEMDQDEAELLAQSILDAIQDKQREQRESILVIPADVAARAQSSGHPLPAPVVDDDLPF